MPGRLEKRMDCRRFQMKADHDPTATSLSTCTVSKGDKRLRVGIMTIRPNLDELIAQFLKANSIHRPAKHAQDMTPKQIIRAVMSDLGQDDIADLCEYLFTRFKKMGDHLVQRSILNDMCEFMKWWRRGAP